MNLRQLAEKDLETILETDQRGNRYPFTVIQPDGYQSVNPVYGYGNDISQMIDPDTGMLVAGRNATFTFRVNHLINEGYTSLPKVEHSNIEKPWVFKYVDFEGVTHTFTIRSAMPDKTIGIITLVLELYNDAT